MKTSGRLVGL